MRHMILQHLEDDPELDLSVAAVMCGRAAMSFCQEHLVCLRRNVPTNLLPLKVSSQVSFALFCETKLKRLRLGYCQGMTLVAAVFAANEDAESEERRTPNLQQIRRVVRTSWETGNGARPTTASLSSFNVCEAFGCRELKWCQAMEISN